MKTTILALSAVAAVSLLASVGCTAPVQTYEPNKEDDQTSKKSSKDKDSDKNDKSTNKNSNAGNTNTPSGSTQTPPSQTQPPPDGTQPPPVGTQPPPGGEQGDACFTQCIAGNPAAKQIDDAFLACLDGGGSEQTCGQQADQACQQNQAACQLLEQCGAQCFGGEEGQP